jgi:multidrug efflux pump subunit AcrA (membrane-fusion protein)
VTLEIETTRAEQALTVPNAALVSRTGAASGPSSAVKFAVWVVQEKAGASKTIYTCPMHPEVKSDKPGRCPKCGMDLVAQQTAVEKVVYTCPMHPEVKSDKPGNCPKCGMTLVPEQTSAAATAHLVEVTTGPSDGQRTQVLSGLKAGQRVITAGIENLVEGRAVQSVPWGKEGPLELPKPAAAPPASSPGAANHAGHGG